MTKLKNHQKTKLRGLRSRHNIARAQRRRPLFESLEQRNLLAFDGVTSLFSVTGEVEPGGSGEITLRFSGGGDAAVLALGVTPIGGGLDPLAVQTFEGDRLIAPLREIDNSSDQGDSIAAVELPIGRTQDFRFVVRGEAGTSGSYQLDIFLIGDLDTTGSVSDFELLWATGAATQSAGAGNFVTEEFYATLGIDFSQDLHRTEFDADQDGDTDGFDLIRVENNYNAPPITIEIADDVDLAGSFTLADTNENGRVDAGEPINYNYLVTNSGSTTLSNVTLTHDIGVTLPLSTVFEPGASEAAVFQHPVTQADLDAGSLSNTATVVGTASSGNMVMDNLTLTVTFPPDPQLLFTQTATLVDDNSNGRPDAGEVINYAYSLTNAGNVTLTGVTLSDPTVTISGNSIPTLAVNAIDNTTFTGTYQLTQADIDAGKKDSLATASASAPGGLITAEASASTPLPPMASLALTKTATSNDENQNGVPEVGETIGYAFTLTNTGNVTLNGVTINDPTVTINGGPITLAPGDIDSATFTATHVISAADIAAGSLTNTATANGTPPSGSDATAMDSATILFAGISVSKTSSLKADNGNGQPDVGEVVIYSYTVTNSGGVPVTGITLTDDQPGLGALVLSDDAMDGVGMIAAGDSETATIEYTITQQDFDAGTLTNTATVMGTATGGVAVMDQDSVTLTFNLNPQITVQQSATLADNNPANGRPDAGEVINYTYTVMNSGNVTLTNVSLSDTLATIAGGPIATLAPGATNVNTFTGSYTITQAGLDAAAVNTVTATGTSLAGQTTGMDMGMPLAQTGAITLTKTATFNDDGVNGVGMADGFPQVGETISYAFTVTNTGNVTLTGVTISDNDPMVSVTGGPITLAPGESNSTTFTGTYPITQADIDAEKKDNTASVSAEMPGGNPQDPSDDVTAEAMASQSLLTPTVLVSMEVLNGIDTKRGITPGDTFDIQVRFRDVANNNQAIASAFVDLEFDEQLVQVVQIIHDADYPQVPPAMADNGSGVIDEVGGIAAALPQDTLVFTIRLMALVAGTATFTTNQPESNPIRIFGDATDQSSMTSYGSLNVQIVDFIVAATLNGPSQVEVNQQFSVELHLQDLVKDQSVAGGYLDLVFVPTAPGVQAETMIRVDEINYDPDYTNFIIQSPALGSISSITDRINDLGAADGVDANNPPADTLVVTLVITALAPGEITLRAEKSDNVDAGIGVFLSEDDLRDKTNYGQLVLTIASASPEGEARSPLDVNADGRVSPLDALIVINGLNAVSGESEAVAVAMDANRDGDLSPLDVLVIVNHINRSSIAATAVAFAEGEANFPALRIDRPSEQDVWDRKLNFKAARNAFPDGLEVIAASIAPAREPTPEDEFFREIGLDLES